MKYTFILLATALLLGIQSYAQTGAINTTCKMNHNKSDKYDEKSTQIKS